MDQVHEYENLVASVLSEGMMMCSRIKGIKLQGIELKRTKCTQRKDRKDQRATRQVNLTETDDIIDVVVVEANLVENKSDWILDTGVSRHFCSNRDLFHDFHDSADDEYVFMGNSATVGVLGKGNVLLKLTSGKTLSLSNVLYVPSLHRNLVSGGLLNRAGLRIVFEADKVIITKNGGFVGKVYLVDGLFVLNTTSNEINSSSAYIVESLDV
ncbi:uncharacterized protein LOC111023645 [Momordica charantia]|uniref:Uncharacterized protein LOC111023645 n=1 Tax=Momordica charantia TaxID=3673 RepID=A0A6J1DRD8_MOMCH|nr:uncharacterized protein LOC111023645 [Momordica charantia]